MNVIRLAPRRVAMAKATPAVGRFYSPSNRPEGATATSEGFSKREQAEEGQYIKKREKEQLKAAQKKADAANEEVRKLQEKVHEEKK
ncbi:hypothetical protein Q5752_002006 [Cryptotrichosporon argae]